MDTRGCFNPRTRKGCDVIRWQRDTTYIVSIHAPARGATALVLREAVHIEVSIHAPARGAT